MKIRESSVSTGSTIVRGEVQKDHGDGTVDFRVEDSGVALHWGDVVRVRKSDMKRNDEYFD